jgi:hypothetical protein
MIDARVTIATIVSSHTRIIPRPAKRTWVTFATQHVLLITSLLASVYLLALLGLTLALSAQAEDTLPGRAVMVLFGVIVLVYLGIAGFCVWPERTATR